MESSPTTQLALSLPVGAPSDQFFVSHSGVIDALSAIESSLAEPSLFTFFHVTGPKGSGKSELLRMFKQRAPNSIAVFDFLSGEPEDDTVAAFISAYESKKSAGGVLLVAAGHVATNPHVTSRLAFALPLELGFPREEELFPLVRALLERRGLRFADPMVEFLVRRLPADPLSLSSIFAKIDELSLAQGKQANRAIVREALETPPKA